MSNGEFYLSESIDVIVEILESGGEFRMYPKGTSMLPLLVQGKDSVVLRKREDGSIQKHEIIFYRRSNGQFVLHRMMKREKNGSYTMCGDNQLMLEKGIESDQILGYVSLVYKGDRPYLLSSLRYRIYVFFWCRMPYRKCVMYSRRILHAFSGKIFKK